MTGQKRWPFNTGDCLINPLLPPYCVLYSEYSKFFVTNIICMHNIWFVARVPHVEQELVTLSVHMSSFPALSGIRVARYLVFYAMYVLQIDVCPFVLFPFGHCVVCPLIYAFWLPIYWPLWNICVTNDHGYVPLVVITSRTSPHSRFVTVCVTILTRWVPLEEQELPTLPEHLSSPPVFSGVRVTRSLVLYVCFVDRCLPFCTLSFGHCVVCSSSIYGLWLPLWYLQTLLDLG